MPVDLNGWGRSTCVRCQCSTDAGFVAVGDREAHAAQITKLGLPGLQAQAILNSTYRKADARSHDRLGIWIPIDPGCAERTGRPGAEVTAYDDPERPSVILDEKGDPR